jgi:dGTPase
VRDGIRAHSWKIDPPLATSEAFCVRYADRIAYLTHDALDAVRAGALSFDSFPAAVRRRFGEPGRGWFGELISAVIDESMQAGEVRMDAGTLEVMHELRDFMFQNVYMSEVQLEHQRGAIEVIRSLVEHLLRHPEELPASFRQTDDQLIVQVTDYVAGMTDRFALAMHDRLFRPELAR